MAKKSRKKSKTTRKQVRKEETAVDKKERLLIKQSKSGSPSLMAISSLFLSLLGLALSYLINFGWALSLLAIIFASVSLKTDKSKGFAITALIIGIIGLIIWFLLFIFKGFSVV